MVKQNGDLRTLVQINKINKPTAELTTAYCTSIHHMTSQLLTQFYFIVSSNILKFVLLNKYRRLSKSSKKSCKYSTKLKKKKNTKKTRKKLHNTLPKKKNGFTHKCNTVREGASESLQLEAYNSAKRASQGLRIILKMKLVVLFFKKKTNSYSWLWIYIYKKNSIQKKTKQRTTHLNTAGKCSFSKNCQLQLQKKNSGARILKKRFGESLEDEVCNAKRLFFFSFSFHSFFCLFLPFKHFVQELRNRTR